MGATIRLNLVAVRQLLSLPGLRRFDDLTEEMRKTLQRRFTSYLARADAHIFPGREANKERGWNLIHPSITHLPDADAILKAVEGATVETREQKFARNSREMEELFWDYHERGYTPAETARMLDVKPDRIYNARKRLYARKGIPMPLHPKRAGGGTA